MKCVVGKASRIAAAFMAVAALSGCAHHPVDCAIGLPWADCLPGTAGYANGVGVTTRENEAKQKVAKQQVQPGKDVYTELIKLDELRKKGIISDAEFEAQKQKVLNHNRRLIPLSQTGP